MRAAQRHAWRPIVLADAHNLPCGVQSGERRAQLPAQRSRIAVTVASVRARDGAKQFLECRAARDVPGDLVPHQRSQPVGKCKRGRIQCRHVGRRATGSRRLLAIL